MVPQPGRTLTESNGASRRASIQLPSLTLIHSTSNRTTTKSKQTRNLAREGRPLSNNRSRSEIKVLQCVQGSPSHVSFEKSWLSRQLVQLTFRYCLLVSTSAIKVRLPFPRSIFFLTVRLAVQHVDHILTNDREKLPGMEGPSSRKEQVRKTRIRVAAYELVLVWRYCIPAKPPFIGPATTRQVLWNPLTNEIDRLRFQACGYCMLIGSRDGD